MNPSAPDRPVELLAEAGHRPVRFPLIVVSHLRWGFVFQRPQHLLTRLVSDFDVYFIEEPVFVDDTPRLHRTGRFGQVEVLTPQTRERTAGFSDEQLAAMKPLIAQFMAERGISEPLVWLYTPMALPLVADMEPRAVIYDCMDDLASFKFAPPQLVAREAELMGIADIVTTGGPSLFEARKHRHPNIHCLPSAVDVEHFAPRNLDRAAPEAALAAELHGTMPHPRLGFFGVIDERLDLDLVARMADLRPDWALVMVGPVVKIDPETLPQRPNIRWVGMQTYEALPHQLSHWDVCLLPFALNEATRFISPTKTLEYLSGGKPVISTRIHDVVSLYGAVVRFGDDAQDFVRGVEQILAESPEERADWHLRAQCMVDSCTWDDTTAQIATLLRDYLTAPTMQIVLPGDGATARPSAATEATVCAPLAAVATPTDVAMHPLAN